jgi:hypothetical protein
MLGPLDTKLYKDQFLSNFSIGYENAMLIADRIFTELQVPAKSGTYLKHTKDKFKVINDIRAPGEYAQVVPWNTTEASYGPLLDHSLDMKLEDEVQETTQAPNNPIPLSPGLDETEELSERQSVIKEIDAFNQCANTAVVTQNVTLSGTSRWGDYANSDPIGDMQTAVDTVAKATVKSAKELTVVMGYEAYSVLRNHPQILDRKKWSAMGTLQASDLAEVFGVKEVIIAESQYNSAGQGVTDSMGYIWGKNAWVFYISEKTGRKVLTFGRTLRKGAKRVFRFRDDRAESEYIRLKDYYQQMIVAAEAGYVLKTVVN